MSDNLKSLAEIRLGQVGSHILPHEGRHVLAASEQEELLLRRVSHQDAVAFEESFPTSSSLQ